MSLGSWSRKSTAGKKVVNTERLQMLVKNNNVSLFSPQLWHYYGTFVTRFTNKLDVWIQGNSAIAPAFPVNLKLFPCILLLKIGVMWVCVDKGTLLCTQSFIRTCPMSYLHHTIGALPHTLGTCITHHQREMQPLSLGNHKSIWGKVTLAEWGLSRELEAAATAPPSYFLRCICIREKHWWPPGLQT